jgi:hypothetical protein
MDYIIWPSPRVQDANIQAQLNATLYVHFIFCLNFSSDSDILECKTTCFYINSWSTNCPSLAVTIPQILIPPYYVKLFSPFSCRGSLADKMGLTFQADTAMHHSAILAITNT